jgi:hypothetical protein
MLLRFSENGHRANGNGHQPPPITPRAPPPPDTPPQVTAKSAVRRARARLLYNVLCDYGQLRLPDGYLPLSVLGFTKRQADQAIDDLAEVRRAKVYAEPDSLFVRPL